MCDLNNNVKNNDVQASSVSSMAHGGQQTSIGEGNDGAAAARQRIWHQRGNVSVSMAAASRRA